MLGNLSKILIKAPSFFNNQQQNQQNNQKETLKKIPEENVVDPFYQINYIKNRENKNNGIYYFKEKDFWKKNLKLDMNFNHNKRLLYNLNISPLDFKKLDYEQGLDINKNNADNQNIDYFNKKRKLSNLSTKNPIRTIRGEKNYNIYKKIFLLNKDNLNDTEKTLKTESNKTNDKLFLKTEENQKKHNKTHNNRYNTNEDNTNFNNNKNNIVINENNNSINSVDKKEINKFPKNINPYKSQESLFQENIDKKLTSLILVKPEIKEQLKSINRSMVGQRDYYVYQKFGRFNSPNPFYESMKKKEEMNKLLK